jgi:hypothetical protein
MGFGGQLEGKAVVVRLLRAWQTRFPDMSGNTLPDISNNVGPVKSFLSALLRSLRRVVFVVFF